jgi:DNA-binding CsgD family transcriptional regulator
MPPRKRVKKWLRVNVGDKLSDRERDAIVLMSEGDTAEEIARKLFVSFGVIKVDLLSAYKKLGARNSRHAIRRAIEEGYIPIEVRSPHVAGSATPPVGVVQH